MGPVVRRRVVVTGLVQGVYFRDTCRRQALGRDVAGWVRNRRGGAVEAVFEGEPTAVEKLVAWSRRGPEDAVVKGVEVFEEEPERLSGFAILPTA
ncbi:MAG: acylphosphatase [Hamadaea sp.]|nr:acylphosphatase [Hamadaea sp.]